MSMFSFSFQVVMNIVIAFILEAFTFRIDYRKSTDKDMDEDALVKVSRSLGRGEVSWDNDCVNEKFSQVKSPYFWDSFWR